MTGKEKAKYIDHFLKGLQDASFPSSLASIIELRQMPSPENMDKFKLLEFELEKNDLVEFVRGRDNSTLNGQCEYFISEKGLDYVLNGKSTLELFKDKKELTTIMDIDTRIKVLTEKAEKYTIIMKAGDIMSSQVNSHDNIALFTDWFLESRELFSEYFDKKEINYSEFIDYNTSGNGFTLSSKFSSLYPLFKILTKKIISEKNKTIIIEMKDLTNKAFIIHGHNESVKLEVARFLDKDLKKESIILHEMPNKGKTVIEKFESNSNVDFAIALWTADDEGKAKKDNTFKNRSRQNVIFETGYFIGKLGRDKVIILFEAGVEKPSDYDGVVYISLSGNWKYELQKEIESIYE